MKNYTFGRGQAGLKYRKEQVEIQVKYDGYITRMEQAERFKT